MRRTPPPWLVGAWGAASLLAAAACLASMLYYSGGTWLFPLDDVYITLSYARQIVSGAPFVYNPGDPVSTGATSLLYTVLTAPLVAIAGRNDAVLVTSVLVLNAAFLWWSCRSLWILAIQILPAWLASLATAALVISGPVLWGSFCGMDTGLFAALILATWDAWTSRLASRGPRWFALPALFSAALALARPEGAVLALAAGAWAAVTVRRADPRRCAACLLIGAAAFLIAILPPRLLTGSAVPSSGWAKIAWASPVVSPTAAAAESLRFAVDAVKGLWTGAYPAEAAVGLSGSEIAGNEVIYALPPAALFLFLLGSLPVGPARSVVSLGAVLWLAGFSAVALLLPVGWHHHRYLIPFFPPFILLSFAGMYRLAAAFPVSWRPALLRTLSAAWLAFSAIGFVKYLGYYGQGAENHLHHHLAMALRLSSMPEPGDVAASDVGIIRYYNPRRVVDIKGLTSPWLAPAAARGWGSLFDEFKSMEPGRRPRFAALHAGRPDVNPEQMSRAGLLLPRFSLPHPRMESRFVLYEFDWPGAERVPGIPGWAVCDEIDCGLAGSENVHRYALRMRARDSTPYSSIQARMDSSTRRAAADGGWVLSGGETFILRADPGERLAILMRTYAPRSSAVLVRVNGAPYGKVPISSNPDRFQTILLVELPREAVQEINRVEVECAWPAATEYSSYHYWALQPVK